MMGCLDLWFVLAAMNERPLHIELGGRRKVTMDDGILTLTYELGESYRDNTGALRKFNDAD